MATVTDSGTPVNDPEDFGGCPVLGCDRPAGPEGLCDLHQGIEETDAAEYDAWTAMCEAADQQAANHMAGEDAFPWSGDEPDEPDAMDDIPW